MVFSSVFYSISAMKSTKCLRWGGEGGGLPGTRGCSVHFGASPLGSEEQREEPSTAPPPPGHRWVYPPLKGGLRSEVTVNSGTFVGGLLHAPWVGGSPSPSAWPRPQRRPRPLAGGAELAVEATPTLEATPTHPLATPPSREAPPGGGRTTAAAPWGRGFEPRLRLLSPPPRTPPSSAPTTPISAPVVPNGGRPNPSVLSVLFLFTVWSPPGGWGGAEGRITLPAAVLHAARRTQNHLFL